MRPAVTFLLAIAACCGVSISANAQTFSSVPAIGFGNIGPVITAPTEALKPFTVAGERGVILGQQDGTFESWVLPVKLLSHMTIEADVEGYSVPIDVNQQSAQIEVRPDRTVITYSHIAFTVRQIMFSPDEAAPGAGPSQTGPAQTGPMVLFEFDCLRPTGFTFRFTPNLEWMWPERNQGVPGIEWASGPAYPGGFYILHSDYPNLAGAIAIPGAQPGILAPYQERPQVHPVEFHLHIDPARDHGRLFPLLMAVGMNTDAAKTPALAATLEALNKNIAASYDAHRLRYEKLLADSVEIQTPDKSLDEAFQWAEVSIEQLRAKVPPSHNGTAASGPGSTVPQSLSPLVPRSETALVAGYYASGDSARPGFGWFFGRDSLYTLYAINGYGDFALSKSELEFLIHRQRADGKIMHEYSQTAADVDWQAFPYMYAAADSTPLFLLAVEDYVRSSGDVALLSANREAIEKAWAFETDPAHDTDHDGIYDNSQGTGWVESWPGGMPHQEIYLALLDQQASAATAQIEILLGDQPKADAARARSNSIAKTIETEYYDPDKKCYAFSHNLDGSQDRTTTVYPALAWWSEASVPNSLSPEVPQSVGPSVPKSLSPLVPRQSPLVHGGECLKQFAEASLATDWGLRDVANTEKIYDGMSYHQGSVWPLFTGWAALAEYRGNQPLAGYQMLKENADLTRAQDLGADTELLSGDFYVPFGRSTSHQLWSSAMVITPTLRGLFGISIDAQTKTITVNPHLPAEWTDARVKKLPIPGVDTDLTFTRSDDILTVRTDKGRNQGWKLRSDTIGAEVRVNSLAGEGEMIAIPLPAVEIAPPQTGSPTPGARTGQFRVVHEEDGVRRIKLTVEGSPDSQTLGKNGERISAVHALKIIRHQPVDVHIEPGPGVAKDIKGPGSYISAMLLDTAHLDPKIPINLYFHFGPGGGPQTITVTLTW